MIAKMISNDMKTKPEIAKPCKAVKCLLIIITDHHCSKSLSFQEFPSAFPVQVCKIFDHKIFKEFGSIKL
jgi:hypothetical protein